MTTAKKCWRLDKNIPIAVIIAFILQVIGAIIWITELDARVSNVEHQSTLLAPANEKFARLEERLDHIKEDTDSLKRQLDRITDRLFKK